MKYMVTFSIYSKNKAVSWNGLLLTEQRLLDPGEWVNRGVAASFSVTWHTFQNGMITSDILPIVFGE